MPYVFVYNNALLMKGSFLQIVSIVLFALIATYIMSCALENFYFTRINWLYSMALITGSILILMPDYKLIILGFIIIGSITVYLKLKQKRKLAKNESILTVDG
jgi:TRAP-type uncharacterized transport system fused permease subunit